MSADSTTTVTPAASSRGESLPQEDAAIAAREHLRWGRILALGLGVVAAVLLLISFRPGETLPKPAGTGTEPAAEARAPADVDTLLSVGESLQRSGRLDEAMAIYDRIPQSAGKAAVAARVSQASTLLYQGKLVAAETQLDRLARIDPQNRHLIGLRTSLLTAAGRRWESLPYLLESIRRDLPNRMTSLIYLANIHAMPAPDDAYFARVYTVGDAYGLLSSARIAASLDRQEHALDLLRRSLEMRPDLVESHIQIGPLLLNSGEASAFERWQAAIPAAAEAHPMLWLMRGRYAQEDGQSDAAVRCYWECLRRDPNQDRACYQIGHILGTQGRTDDARPFLERAGRLAYLIEEATILYDSAGGKESLMNCARTCLDLGRIAEADAWCQVLLDEDATHPEALALRRSIADLGFQELPWLLPEADLSRQFSFAHLPLPSYSPAASPAHGSRSMASRHEPQFRFEDQARQLGIEFTYRNGDDPDVEGRRMFEYTGGGVGVIDFDLDGWPDMHLTQGSDWPPDAAQRIDLDHLYRNLAGLRFEEVAQFARIADGGFGQGVSVGDFDSDGFPDLYVANLNGNHLYRNNGEGTFEDVTAASGVGHEYWSTSCLLADINADGLADIYDVTFLQGDAVFSAVCRGEDGVARSCAPKGFEAAPDFVYFNQGDGTFRQAGAESGFDVPNGDGLGIVAADLDQSGRLGIFIANDGRPNFYLAPLPSEQGVIEKWEERGLLSGLAYDEVGASQACMGVGAEDADHDGLIDLFVTNFYQESNTLYLNMGGGAFLDQSRSFGLHEASLKELGFGTQFLDADLDGWSEIVLVNGHVDDFTYKNIPYRMRPQLFRNLQGDRFVEIPRASLGAYFQKVQLGRGLATLDWNRDGRPDFVVSNLEDPTSLVTNTTSPAGAWFSLRLVGRTRSRDAIGTRVIVHAGELTYERQLTAGDGYQASNERRLIFGLGSQEQPVSIEILWPGGETREYSGIEVRREYMAVEGRDDLLALPAASG